MKYVSTLFLRCAIFSWRLTFSSFPSAMIKLYFYNICTVKGDFLNPYKPQTHRRRVRKDGKSRTMLSPAATPRANWHGFTKNLFLRTRGVRDILSSVFRQTTNQIKAFGLNFTKDTKGFPFYSFVLPTIEKKYRMFRTCWGEFVSLFGIRISIFYWPKLPAFWGLKSVHE